MSENESNVPLPDLEKTGSMQAFPEGAPPADAGGDDSGTRSASDLEAVFDVPVQVSAVLGRSRMDVGALLKLSRLPAKAAGLGELQAFLERGFAAFAGLGDARAFLDDIRGNETRTMQRLFAGEADPFRD
jgi:hypothetical protein